MVESLLFQHEGNPPGVVQIRSKVVEPCRSMGLINRGTKSKQVLIALQQTFYQLPYAVYYEVLFST